MYTEKDDFQEKMAGSKKGSRGRMSLGRFIYQSSKICTTKYAFRDTNTVTLCRTARKHKHTMATEEAAVGEGCVRGRTP